MSGDAPNLEKYEGVWVKYPVPEYFLTSKEKAKSFFGWYDGHNAKIHVVSVPHCQVVNNLYAAVSFFDIMREGA